MRLSLFALATALLEVAGAHPQSQIQPSMSIAKSLTSSKISKSPTTASASAISKNSTRISALPSVISSIPTSAPKNATTPATSSCAPYWLEFVKHQGVSAFNPDNSYQVFRNVKDFGAKGMLYSIYLR
jgi:hypothetical protein